MNEQQRIARRVLLIGWDAADWKIIDKLFDQDAMPFMKSFMERGSWGNLATLQPSFSPMLWNSIATGKRPYKHGIHGFIEPMPDGKGVRPSSSTTRTSKALWNILTQSDMVANVVGWFCGHPAEPIEGICVTEMFQKFPGEWSKSTELPLPEKCVHPVSMRDEIEPLRIHPAELTDEEILPFIPQAAKIDQQKDRRLMTFAKMLAEMASVHNAATWVVGQNDWDLTAVYYDSIDHFCHGFMQYHPPQLANVKDEDFEIYQGVVEGCYRFHDAMLGALLKMVPADTTVILCSDHGFHSDHLRPLQIPRQPAGPAICHRDYGIIAMAGPGIKEGETILGASLIDIAPTVLTLLGLPTGEDMDGKPLLQAMDGPPRPKQIASWEEVPGEAGMHPPDEREDPFAAREGIKQLVELGYIEQPDENEEQAAANAAREAKYNLALSYEDGGHLDEAATRLEELYRDNPDIIRFGVRLVQVWLQQGHHDKVRPLAEELLDKCEQRTAKQAKNAEERARELKENRADVVADLHERFEKAYKHAVEAEKEQAAEESREPREIPREELQLTDEMLDKQQQRFERLAERLHEYNVRDTPLVHLTLAQLELMDRNEDQALVHLREAENANPRLPGLHLKLGEAFLRMRQSEDGARAFEEALEIDGDSALAHVGLAVAYTRLRRLDEALDHALTAVELLHELPRGHLWLGVILARMEMYEQAVEAFQACLKLAPRTAIAHRWLTRIYAKKLNRPDLALKHRAMVDPKYAFALPPTG